MKIIKFKKMSGSKYKVFFDNGKNILLHENIIIKYNLLITKKIEEDYDDIIKDNNNYMMLLFWKSRMNAVASIFLVLCGLFRRYMVL